MRFRLRKLPEQYMQVLDEHEESSWDVASEFLVMAATLLAIKSKMLLPKQEVFEEDFMMEEDEWFEDPGRN